MAEVSSRVILQSWKEIAGYLRVTVRSVQRWEKNAGLPVHRQGTGSRAKVFAYSDELQSWLESGGERRRQEESEKFPPPRPAGAFSRVRAAALFVLLPVAAGLLFWWTRAKPATPQHWNLENSLLKVLDGRDRLLWFKRMPEPDPRAYAFTEDRVLIRDIDEDGRNEVLVNLVPKGLASAGSRLQCYEQDGRLRWDIPHGRARSFGARNFDSAYVPRFVKPVKSGGKPALLVISNHLLWYPGMAALIAPADGKVLEEYWHPGWIYQCLTHDLDGDGADEMIVGALNNPGEGLGHAGVGILKIPFSSTPRGNETSPLPHVTGGGEMIYCLFPLPDLCRVTGLLPQIVQMNILGPDRISVHLPLPDQGLIVYELDFRLKLLEYRFSDNFVATHNRYRQMGFLDHDVTPAERQELGKLLYFPWAPDGNSPALDKLWAK